MPVPIETSAAQVDLSQRFGATTTVGASPSAATETIIGTLVLNTDLAIISGVRLDGWCAFTVGTSGTAARLRIRQTNVSGTVVADSGATTAGIAAGNLATLDVSGFDTAAAKTGQTYVLTLQITAGAATSTVSALALAGIIV